MKIYIGRLELFDSGIADLEYMDQNEVAEELEREKKMCPEDKRIDTYTPAELEAEWNNDIDGSFNTGTYWIRIFN